MLYQVSRACTTTLLNLRVPLSHFSVLLSFFLLKAPRPGRTSSHFMHPSTPSPIFSGRIHQPSGGHEFCCQQRLGPPPDLNETLRMADQDALRGELQVSRFPHHKRGVCERHDRDGFLSKDQVENKETSPESVCQIPSPEAGLDRGLSDARKSQKEENDENK